MFKKILIATDFSEASRMTVACAAGLSHLGTVEAVLCQVLDVSAKTPALGEFHELEKRLLAEQKAVLEAAGIATQIEMVTASADSSINDYADKHGCTALVVGSHGANLASEFLLGGVAYNILHATRLPTLVVRLKNPHGELSPCAHGACDLLSHVLLPTDFSDHAERAMSVVAKLIALGARRVSLLHVQDSARIQPYLSDRLEEFNRIDQRRLERIAGALDAPDGCAVETALAFGRPGPEIVRFAEEKACSLIVAGTQGRSAMAEFFLGSVSHYAARHSAIPTLLIPILADA